MRIAQVAPLFESIPPQLYGGSERVVHYLTEELVRQGHEVTLFASGDSITSARLIACCPRALRLDADCTDPLAHHFVMLSKVFKSFDRFDVFHFHLHYWHFPLSRLAGITNVTTLHGRLDIPDLAPLSREYAEMPLVSISNSQRRPLPWLNWQATVYHGLPPDLLSFREGAGGYLAFLGRISPEKRVDRAIEVAKRVGMQLKIAAKVDKVDQEYFEGIRPLLKHPLVEFLGEIRQSEKEDFLGDAYALLFPIDWEEPFGLVMIEAMACGTPVIAYNRGSVPELVQDGITGFVVNDEEGAARAVEKVSTLDRRKCRQSFEERFTATRMARDYISLYKRLLERRQRSLLSKPDEFPDLAALDSFDPQ